MGYKAATGINVGEKRYEAGDKVPDDHVEQWMVEEGIVIGKAPAAAAPASSTGGE